MKNDLRKTKHQLIDELDELRQRLVETGTPEQAEDELRHSEDRFRSLADYTTDAVFCYEYDPPIPTDLPIEHQIQGLYKGILLNCNDVAARSYGAAHAEEVIGKSLTELFGTVPNSLDDFFEAFIRSGYAVVDSEASEVLDDGTQRFFVNSGHGVFDGTALARVWGTFRDVTEQKRVENELRASEQKYRELVETSPDLIAVVDASGSFVFVNRQMEETWGVVRDDIVGRSGFDSVHTDDRADALAQLDKAFKGQAVRNHELRFVRPDGNLGYDLVNATPLTDADGNVRTVLVVSRDVTERKRLENSLEAQRKLAVALAGTSRLDDALALCLDAGLGVAGLDSGGIYLVDEASGTLRLMSYRGLSSTFVESASFFEAGSPQADIALKGRPIYSRHHELGVPVDGPRLREGLRAIAVVPVKHEGRVIACLNVASRSVDDIDADARDSLEATAAQIGSAIARIEAEEALRQSEETVRAYLEGAPDGVYICDFDGVFLYGNRRAEEITGYLRDELVGRNFFDLDLLPPEYGAEAIELLELNRAGLSTGPDELELMRKDGSRVQVEITTAVVRQSEGKVVLGFVRDITKRKQVEDALQASRERLLKAERAAHIGHWGMDFVTGEAYWSDEDYRLLGYDPETVEPSLEAFLDVLEPADREAVQKATQNAMVTGIPYDIDVGVIRPDGTRRTLNARAEFILDTEGKAVSMLGTTQDVTERKNAEEELRRFRMGIERSTEAVFITTIEGEITYVNPAFEELYGYTEAEALGETPRILKSGLIPAQAYKDFWSNLLAGKPVVGEIPNKTKDGSIVTVDNSANPIPDAGGNIIGFLAIQRDVTDRKRIEAQAAQSQLLASLGEMTTGIAHEVNNPLAAILLYSELVSQAKLPPAVKKDLKVIRSEAKRASNIVKDLLTYSRKAAPITRRIDIHKSLKKVVDMRQYQEHVRNISIDAKFASHPLRVNANAAQLTQVFMNLIVNAEEAVEESDDKRIVVTTGTDGEMVRISVADGGAGIQEEHLKQLFVPFFSTKPKGRGTGLGLATCHGIVTAHGGLIHAENNDMGGATFTVELPLAGKTR